MKGLHKQTFDPHRDLTSWMKEDEAAKRNEEKVRATTKIILHLIDYMESHQMSQTDLARKLNVTPQYINKLLHGQDTSFRIETAIEYGKLLGITLIEIPDAPIGHPSMYDVFYGTYMVSTDTPGGFSFGVDDLVSAIVNPKKKQIWKQEKSLAFV